MDVAYQKSRPEITSPRLGLEERARTPAHVKVAFIKETPRGRLFSLALTSSLAR